MGYVTFWSLCISETREYVTHWYNTFLLQDPKFLFRLYMARHQYQEAAKTAIIVANEEQINGTSINPLKTHWILQYLSHWYAKFKCPMCSFADRIKCLVFVAAPFPHQIMIFQLLIKTQQCNQKIRISAIIIMKNLLNMNPVCSRKLSRHFKLATWQHSMT
jgi:hypothetical protein